MELPSRYYATRLDLSQGGLGDALVERVLPRAPGSRPRSGHEAATNPFFSGASAMDLPTMRKRTTQSSLRCVAGSPFKLRPSGKKVTEEDKNIKRREQCRANQARYRMRQQNRQLGLEQSVRQLRGEVERLKRGIDSAQSGGRTKCNPWTIIAKASRLLDKGFSSPGGSLHGEDMANFTAFYQECFSPDAAMGDACGVNSLLEQAWRWSTHFDYHELQLKRIESTAPGVMTATASLSVTVSERSIGSFFPSLLRKSQHNEKDPTDLAKRLLDQRLELNCSMTFLLDEDTGRVACLEHEVDFVGPLLRTLGSLEEVSSVLHDQRIWNAASQTGLE